MSLFSSAPLVSAAAGAAAGGTTNADFMSALSQPLLIQTPLQLSVLAADNALLKAKLTEREQAAQLEMQDLRKFCIASQERDSEKDTVAYQELQQQQQQILGHLSTVESLANQAIAGTQHISTRLDKEFKSRLDTLSVKLHGVDNMLGHQLAVHEMAGLLGVAVAKPQVQPAAVVPAAPTEGDMEAAFHVTTCATAAADAAEASVVMAADNLVSVAESSPPDSAPAELPPAEPAAGSVAAFVQSQAAPGKGQSPGALVQRGLSLGQGVGQLSRGASRSGGVGLLPQLKTQLEVLEDKELELRLHVEMLRDDMSLQKKEMQAAQADIGGAVAVTANIDSRFHVLDTQMQDLLKKIRDDQAAHDKAAANRLSPVMPVIMGKAGDKVQGVTVADMYVLQDQIRVSSEGVRDFKQRLDQFDKRTAWVQSNCMDAAAVAAAEATAVTHSFQAQLAALQQDMQSLDTKVDQATSSAQEQGEDLQKYAVAVDDLALKMRQKLGPEDWSRISQRAVAAAEAALQQSLLGEMQRDSNSPAGASRFRCLSCDTDLRAQRGMQQQGRRSPPPSKPSLLPKLLALDPNSAALFSTSRQAPDPGAQQAKSEGLRYCPGASATPDSAALMHVTLPELHIAQRGVRNTDSPPAPFWPNTNVSFLDGPGNAAMPPSIAARISPTLQMPYDAADSSVAASGLPKQLEGVISGDRKSPVLQPMGLDKRAWQVPATRDRPMKPIFTV